MGSGIQVDQTHVSSRGLQNTHSETKDGQTTITISDATQQLIFKHIGDQNTSNILQNSNWAGFMKKRGRINKTWTTRLFVLKGSLLTYYEAEEHPSIKVIARKGAVSVLNATMVGHASKVTMHDTDTTLGAHAANVANAANGVEKTTATSSAGGGNEMLLELVLHDKERRLMMEFQDLKSMNQWKIKLLEASQSTNALSVEDTDILQQHSKSKAAHCAECTSTFSMFKKDYQCPACGLAFCSSCSSKRLPLPEITGTNDVVRVCNSCYKIESSKLIAKQADAKRQREENELLVRRREVMSAMYWWYQDVEDGVTKHGA